MMRYTTFIYSISFAVLLSCNKAPTPPQLKSADRDDSNAEGEGGDFENLPEDPDIVPTIAALSLKPITDESGFVPLSHSQLENALHVVFNVPANQKLIETNLPAFASTTMFDNDGQSMTMDFDMIQSYGQLASVLVDKLVLKANLYSSLIPANASKAFDVERAKSIVKPILNRAFRGKVSDAEVNSYASIFAAGIKAYPSDGFDKAGFRALIPAILFSPKFIMTEKFGGESSDGKIALTSSELASRLSSALWNSIPNDNVLQKTAKLDPKDEPNWNALIDSMVKEEAFQNQVTRFNIYAFRADSIHLIDRNNEQWNAKNKALIRQETDMFFNYMTKNDKGLTEILTAPYAFVSDATASLYKVTSPGAAPQKVDLDTKERRGFYSQVGFNAFYADGLGNQTVRRGASIVKSLVCSDALNGKREEQKPIAGDATRTNRESVAFATEACGGSCHKPLMNPIGYAFEVFGNNGQWQDKDRGKDINAADVLYLSDKRKISFDGAADFSEKLAAMYETHRCYASKVVQYTFGRIPGTAEANLITDMAEASLKGASTKELFMKAVKSDAFRYRAAK